MKKIILPILLFAAVIYTNAQDAMTNSGNLQIHSGASVSGFANFTNSATGSLVNNGSLYMKGAVTNNQSSMATGTGTLYLNGSVAQSVNGSQPLKVFNFVSDNNAGIILSNNVHVSGAHTFTNGIIASPSPYFIAYESGSSYSGSNDANHVSGWIKKLGSTDFIFPVGNGTVQRTVALNNLSASSEFNVRFNAGNPPSMNSTQLPLRDVDEYEYWTINKVSGGTAQVNLNWDGSKIYFPNWILSDIVVAGFNGSLWTDNGGTASGDVSTTFNMFTFGSISWVLPMTLIDFTAKRQDNYTKINWKTASEYNMSHFIVERSDDGASFYSIGQVSARNRGIIENYQQLDHVPINKIAYYRLRCVNKDGKEILSRIVTVTESNGGDLLLLNNPVHDRIRLLAGSTLKGSFHYQITMTNGQLVQQGTLTIQTSGQYEIPMNVKMQSGTYVLKVSDQVQSFDYKLLVL
jgi:hypothetical protein